MLKKMKCLQDEGWKTIAVKEGKMKSYCEHAKSETSVGHVILGRAESSQSLEERLERRWRYEGQLQGEVCCSLRISKNEKAEKEDKCNGQGGKS